MDLRFAVVLCFMIVTVSAHQNAFMKDVVCASCKFYESVYDQTVTVIGEGHETAADTMANFCENITPPVMKKRCLAQAELYKTRAGGIKTALTTGSLCNAVFDCEGVTDTSTIESNYDVFGIDLCPICKSAVDSAKKAYDFDQLIEETADTLSESCRSVPAFVQELCLSMIQQIKEQAAVPSTEDICRVSRICDSTEDIVVEK